MTVSTLAVGQVERIDRASDFPELQLAVIRGAHPDAGAVDDGFGELAKAGAPMNAALQHDITLLQRIDAEAQKAVEVGRLAMPRDQHEHGRARNEPPGRPHSPS